MALATWRRPIEERRACSALEEFATASAALSDADEDQPRRIISWRARERPHRDLLIGERPNRLGRLVSTTRRSLGYS